MGKGTGNRKSSKKDQPKRKRYNAEKRGLKHAIRDLTRHLKRHEKDQSAIEALEKKRQDLGMGR